MQYLALQAQAVTFWQSVEGGCKDHKTAKAMWDHLVAVYKDEQIPYAMDGPEHAPLRIRVHMYDDVDYKNVHMKAKEAIDSSCLACFRSCAHRIKENQRVGQGCSLPSYVLGLGVCLFLFQLALRS